MYACETGSRAWGFPSPDSDYDVRFLYMHNRDWYLHLGKHKDTIEVMDGDLDVSGWDLKKSLQLLKKSNAALLERFSSPIVYYERPGFADAFRKLIDAYYSPTAVFWHHYSLANGFWDGIKDAKEVKLKAYFYLLRSLLSCNWVVQDNNVPPMHVAGLLQYVDDNVKREINALIALKATVGEKYLHPTNAFLNQWILHTRALLEQKKQSLPVNKLDYSLLNHFFIQMLTQ